MTSFPQNEENKPPKSKLKIGCFYLFIGFIFLIMVMDMDIRSEHRDRWNTYSAQVDPLLAKNKNLFERIFAFEDKSEAIQFIQEAEELEKQIKAVDGATDEIDNIHQVLERHAKNTVKALKKMKEGKEANDEIIIHRATLSLQNLRTPKEYEARCRHYYRKHLDNNH